MSQSPRQLCPPQQPQLGPGSERLSCRCLLGGQQNPKQRWPACCTAALRRHTYNPSQRKVWVKERAWQATFARTAWTDSTQPLTVPAQIKPAATAIGGDRRGHSCLHCPPSNTQALSQCAAQPLSPQHQQPASPRDKAVSSLCLKQVKGGRHQRISIGTHAAGTGHGPRAAALRSVARGGPPSVGQHQIPRPAPVLSLVSCHAASQLLRRRGSQAASQSTKRPHPKVK